MDGGRVFLCVHVKESVFMSAMFAECMQYVMSMC